MNIYIPKNKKKLKKSNFDIKKISNFEKKIFDIYNLGKIKYPIHLTKGNEVQLYEIFKYIHTINMQIMLLKFKLFEIKKVKKL